MMLTFFRWAWRVLPIPEPIRRKIIQVYQYPPLPHTQRRSNYAPGTPLLAGFTLSGLGIGEMLRLQILALREEGVEHDIRDVSDIMKIRDLVDPAFEDSLEPANSGPLILNVNAPEFGRALRFMGKELTGNRPIIGQWAWELPEIPKDWKKAYKYIDELWVLSNYTKQAFTCSCPVPIKVVPPPVVAPVDNGLRRNDFCIPSNATVFLAMADARSDIERKNISGVVKAFKKMAKNVEGVLLVIKLHHTEFAHRSYVRLWDEIRSDVNIVVIDRLLERGAVGALIRCCDILVSLHRAEGLGLPLAEAMLLGKPVIATGFSGNMDFMDDECAKIVNYRMIPVSSKSDIYVESATQLWADPDLDSATDAMTELASSPSLRLELGEKGMRRAQAYFSVDRYCRTVRNALKRWI